MIQIRQIQTKAEKKQPAKEVKQIQLIKDFGPEGDAYGGPGDRQIIILGDEDIELLKKDREMGLCIKRFVSNVTISGSSQILKRGEKYSLGNVEILISDFSKKCYSECPIRSEEKRVCHLPQSARFASILNSGVISIDDTVELISS